MPAVWKRQRFPRRKSSHYAGYLKNLDSLERQQAEHQSPTSTPPGSTSIVYEVLTPATFHEKPLLISGGQNSREVQRKSLPKGHQNLPIPAPQWSTLVDTTSSDDVITELLLLTAPPISRVPPSPAIIEAYQTIQKLPEGSYTTLLWFCVCVVARKNGTEYQQVDELTDKLLACNLASTYAARQRTTSKWVASLIEHLEAIVGCQGSQFFLNCGQTLRTYDNWKKQGSSQIIAEKIGSRFKVNSAELSDDLSTEESKVKPRGIELWCSPTFLITRMGLWSLEQVNRALGTKLSQKEYDQRCCINQRSTYQRRRGGSNPSSAEKPNPNASSNARLEMLAAAASAGLSMHKEQASGFRLPSHIDECMQIGVHTNESHFPTTRHVSDWTEQSINHIPLAVSHGFPGRIEEGVFVTPSTNPSASDTLGGEMVQQLSTSENEPRQSCGNKPAFAGININESPDWLAVHDSSTTGLDLSVLAAVATANYPAGVVTPHPCSSWTENSSAMSPSVPQLGFPGSIEGTQFVPLSPISNISTSDTNQGRRIRQLPEFETNFDNSNTMSFFQPNLVAPEINESMGNTVTSTFTTDMLSAQDPFWGIDLTQIVYSEFFSSGSILT